MNKRQKKKLWNNIEQREVNWAKKGIHVLGGGIVLPYGWIYNNRGLPTRLI